jgi:steroid 5-alpha reductase family enzyme
MFGQIVQTWAWSVAAVFIYMTSAFLLSRKLGRSDIVDSAWGGGFIVVAVVSLSQHLTNASQRALLVTLLVAIWGIRLLLHISLRNRGKKEDFRYAQRKSDWGKNAWSTYRSVFLAQGFFMILVSSSVIIINTTSTLPLVFLDRVGILIWLVGFVFEAVGDRQLAIFLATPENKGKLCTGGLWRYSRHPNYFGELTQWWAIWIIALSVPFGWLGIVGPITISTLVIFVSGVPLLEKHYAGRPDWETYKSRTSMLIPMLPRKS